MTVQFSSGAVRGSDCARGFSMLPAAPLRRFAAAMVEGVEVKGYPRWNWLKGIPADNLVDHLIAHILDFLAGDSSEDHLGHAMWNLGVLIHFAETRPDLFDNMPPGCLAAAQRWAEADDANKPDPLTGQIGHESGDPT